jgi:hypothetical protein
VTEKNLVREDITTILYEEIDTAYFGGGMTVVVGYDEAIERITKYIEEFYVARD